MKKWTKLDKKETNLIWYIKNSILNLFVYHSNCFCECLQKDRLYYNFHTDTFPRYSSWELRYINLAWHSFLGAGDWWKKFNKGFMMWLLVSSTFWAVFVEVSMKINPFSLLNCSPSSVLTAQLYNPLHQDFSSSVQSSEFVIIC